MSFFASYFIMFTIVAGFFACVTTATFEEITTHPAYLTLGSISYILVAGFIADDVWENLK